MIRPLIPSGNRDRLRTCLLAMDRAQPGSTRYAIVGAHGAEVRRTRVLLEFDCTVVEVPEPFVYAQAIATGEIAARVAWWYLLDRVVP